VILYRETDCVGPGPWEKLRIEDAKPRETMVTELMQQIAHGSPWARLDGESREAFPLGRVLTIWDDYGHRYIYKVTGYDWQADSFELEWPD
jgi:hypothetical protein